VVAVAWFAQRPPSALGLGPVTAPSVGAGLAVGVGLYAASGAATAAADRLGIEYDERLRDLLAPDGPAEWALMLLVILPVVAGAEELLFRGALIGALGAGFGLPIPVLVVASSILFGAGHSAQGALGVVATAAMGLVLGTAFVLTGSLAAVVVAHYVVNALEFVVREGVYG
jgi:membrane protease YdiL (CAAX protease family)